ncbi:DNA repair protein RecO [Sphingomonas sp. ZT3P38]|uniref:DNA repair protein RecO n=1 Tax=Parasphingomonas zepuensis TaxID=3096161 RepID=UPI002FC7B574
MHLRAEALVLAIRQHGEHGAIVRALTAEHGLQAGYVRGGRSRRIRPILQPANLVLGEWRARTEDQLAGLTVELIHSRAPLFAEPLPAAALEWVTALTATALPEGQPYPRLHAALTGVIGAIEAAPAARGWALALARYELLLLAELGYGIEPDRLPEILRTGGEADWADILAALRLTGEALEADILTDRRAETLAARARLIDRLKRAVA